MYIAWHKISLPQQAPHAVYAVYLLLHPQELWELEASGVIEYRNRAEPCNCQRCGA